MESSDSQSQTTNYFLWDQKTGTFSTDMLKLTAMVTMLIDHIGAGILEYLMWLDSISEQARIILVDVDQVLRHFLPPLLLFTGTRLSPHEMQVKICRKPSFLCFPV